MTVVSSSVSFAEEDACDGDDGDKMHRFGVAAAASLAFVFGTAFPAVASTITATIEFSANNFYQVLVGGLFGPDPVHGSFTVTFDPSQDYEAETTGITLHNVNLVLGSPFSFDYDHALDAMSVGGDQSWGADYVQLFPTTDDFALAFTGIASGSPQFVHLIYSQTSLGDWVGEQSNTGTVAFAPTPLPPALPLFLAALSSMAYLGWRKRVGVTG